MFWLAQWVLRKQDERFLKSLIETRAQVDEIADQQVRKVLLEIRLGRAIEPYLNRFRRFLYIFKLGKEIFNGRYRKPRSEDNSGANAPSGGGAGTVGQPITQAGFGYSNAAPASITGASAGGFNRPSYFEDAGVVAGEVVGYRCWRLKEDGLLYSDVMDWCCWKPEEVLHAGEGDLNAGKGIHAFKSTILACKFAGVPEGYVTGSIEMWGEVYEHARGYRSQFAAIRSIDDSAYYDAKALRKLYGLNKRKKKST